MSGLVGGGLSKFGGVPSGQGLGAVFKNPMGTNITREIAGRPMQAASFPKQSIFNKGLNLIKAHPIKSALAGLGIAGALGAGEEETGEIDIEKVYGTQSPFRDLGQADIAPTKLIPYGSAQAPYGFSLANGGIVGLANGGDFPRKSGKISGPGTETSDEIPAKALLIGLAFIKPKPLLNILCFIGLPPKLLTPLFIILSAANFLWAIPCGKPAVAAFPPKPKLEPN